MSLESKYIDRSESPLRYQSLYGKPVEIRDVSDKFEEKPSISKPDINVISASKLFKPDEVVLGVGKPNVFLLMDDEKGNQLRYAAKSCYRAPSKLERTRGKIQSGVFVVLKGLSDEQIQNIKNSAQFHEGETSRTCVNANARVLSDAGITLGNGEKIDDVQLPMTIFHSINEQGLKIDGQDIDLEVVKTTNKYLEDQMWETRKAVWFTLYRHAERALSSVGPKSKPKKKIESESQEEKKERFIMKDEDFHKRDFDLEVSNVSRLVVPLRLLWGPHTVFNLKQDRVDIDEYLEGTLTPYPDEKPSFFTKLKKNVLFNSSVVGFINKFMQKGNSTFSGNSEADFHNMFEVHSDEKNNKYNIVASASGIMVSKVKGRNKVADWLLTKHVLVSNYNEDVRFAGEIWKDNDGVIWINNDSGTYKPNKEKLEVFIEYARELFPNIDIRIAE